MYTLLRLKFTYISSYFRIAIKFFYRLYKKLPEVVRREKDQKRYDEYKVNRLKASIFNKVYDAHRVQESKLTVTIYCTVRGHLASVQCLVVLIYSLGASILTVKLLSTNATKN